MNRRNFLQVAAASGVALLSPFGRRRAEAAPRRYEGPYWLLIHGSGGWDPTYVCDPKGEPINKLFKRTDIGALGNHRFAPVEYKNQQGEVLYRNEDFFRKFGSKLLVINGLDTTTGNHDTGTRVTWSGRVNEGHPTLAALLAGAHTPGNPLGFISSGGYDFTAGLAPLVRLGNVDAARRVAYPNRIDPTKATHTYHSAATYERIQARQRERLERLQGAQGLPALQRSMGALYVARSGESELDLLAQKLPSQAAINGATNSLHRQSLVALAGFNAGLAVAANLVLGGFDTHGNHDANHLPRLHDLLQGVDLIMDEITRQGLDNKVIVVVGSDFGRTPAYNVQNGKDHWNITSMMMMGPGIPGNRVVGASDDGFKAKTFDPRTLAESAGGTRIRCEHVQRALRRLARIEGSEVAARYPLPGDDLPLFT